MNTQDVMVLEWAFSPPDHFEEPVSVSRDDYRITIRDGKIEARMASSLYDANSAIKDVIEDALTQRFRGVQLLSHGAYELTYAGRFRVDADGHRDAFVTVGTATLTAKARMADIVLTDKNGNVTYSSRKERIDKKNELAELAEEHGARNALAKSLLGIHHAAITDHENELVRLYEVCDALAKEFGGIQKACDALKFSRSRWSTLGRIANDEPLKQGRHRGKFVGNLRDATENELQEAREIARDLVVAYLQFLEEKSP